MEKLLSTRLELLRMAVDINNDLLIIKDELMMKHVRECEREKSLKIKWLSLLAM